MDNNGNGGVYAAEKIIRKRYKKVNQFASNPSAESINSMESEMQLFMFSVWHRRTIDTHWVHCRHLCLIECFSIQNCCFLVVFDKNRLCFIFVFGIVITLGGFVKFDVRDWRRNGNVHLSNSRQINQSTSWHIDFMLEIIWMALNVLDNWFLAVNCN